MPIYDSPKYDSVDWAYYYDDILPEATTTNYQDFNDDDFDGDWDYYYDYEPETEASNSLEELDGAYEERQPTSVSTLVENLHSAVTADQLLLPPFSFEEPCSSSWPPEAAGLLLEETRAVPNPVTELSLANFGKNPEQPQQGPILGATPQLDEGMSSLPPVTDKVDQVADSFEMGTEIDPPVPATNPVPTVTAIRRKTAGTTILGHYPPADLEPKAEPAMTYPPAPVDILPPPYPGDVGVDPIEYFGLNYLQSELSGYNKVAPRAPQPPKTQDVKPQSTATTHTTPSSANQAPGDTTRSPYEEFPTGNPVPVHPGNQPSNPIPAQNVKATAVTKVSNHVNSPPTQYTGSRIVPALSSQAATKATQGNQSTPSNTGVREPAPTNGQPPAPRMTEIAANSTRLRPPGELTVDVWINGKPTRCLIDTGGAVSVLDTKHLEFLYDGKPPPLQPSALSSIRTVSGQPVPIRGTFSAKIEIAGGKYPCLFRVIDGIEYQGVLGRDFLYPHRAEISFASLTMELKEPPSVMFSEDLAAVIAPTTYVIPPRSEVVLPAQVTGNTSPGVIGLIESVPRLVERYQLQGAVALVKIADDQTVPFRLINPTSCPVTLRKGATPGTFSEADGNPDLSPVGTPATNQPTPNRLDTVPVDFSKSVLTPEEQARLRCLLNEYRDIFAVQPDELGRTNIVQHHIETGNHPTIRSRPYRVPHAQREVIDKHIDDMLHRNVIQPSASPWASPVVLVPKPDGSSRFCVDFRKLNKITKKDSYPLPLISESLEALGGARFFSSLDMISGYWQVEMNSSSKEKTAFVTHSGLYEFTIMPFGLFNAPGTFQRLMECVLRGLTWQIALIYLDDVLVYSRTFDDHLQHLRLVFDRFRTAGLKLKPSKCHFGQKQVNYLGHVITRDGIQPDPEKIKVVQEYPVPSTVKDVRAFMGLTNYYRKFVKDFAHIASPLHDLTKKGAAFLWTEECQTAFETLKQVLTEAPILAYPDFTQPFQLATDASNDAIGMVLGQKRNGKEVVIAYAGRKLNPAERNYSVSEREALAVVDGVRHFQPYLYGRPFTVLTDHSAVRWLMNIKEPTGCLARWALLLQQHDFTIQHRSGLNNGNADALSRRPYDSVVAALDKPGLQIERVKELQRMDPSLVDIINYFETERLPNNSSAARAIMHTIDNYYLDPNGLLCHLWVPKGRRVPGIKSQLVVPTPLRHEILIGGHDDPLAGHLGVNKTHEKLRERYYWPKMFADVQFWCLSCTHCQMKKSPKQRQTAPVLPIPVEGAFDRVAVDCLGPFPVSNSGNRYIVVFSDCLTRYPEAFAVPSIDAPTIADLLVNEILPRHGAPRTLFSDRGSNFLSSLVREVCFLMDTKKTYTTSYHPQCDGLVERFNGTLAQSLSHYVSSSQKDRYLNPVLFGFRISPSEVTGESPFFLLYGRQPRLPMDVSMLPPRDISASIADHRARVVENIEIAQRIAKENIQRAQQRMKDYHDLHAVPVRFQVGDSVWVYTPRNRKGLSKKLAHNWHGPYRIVQFLSPVHCILRALDNRRVSTTVHVSRL